jgi:hypothetical protein
MSAPMPFDALLTIATFSLNLPFFMIPSFMCCSGDPV